MVDDINLHKIEYISEDLLELIQTFDKSICHLDVKERFKIRAKSSLYQTLSSLVKETISMKQDTNIDIPQLQELKRKIKNLIRLVEDTGFDACNEQLLIRLVTY